jgi:hypothetical protein
MMTDSRASTLLDFEQAAPQRRFDAELRRNGGQAFPSQAFAVCPCRILEGEQYGLQKNRSSIQPGLSLVSSRSDRRYADEFSRV